MTARRDIEAITDRIRERSRASRETYLGRIDAASGQAANRALHKLPGQAPRQCLF